MTTIPFESLSFHALRREADSCQNETQGIETHMNSSQTSVIPYQLRRKGFSAPRNASELQNDIRATVRRIRNLMREGDTQLAYALTFTVNRMRDEVANGETQIQWAACPRETQTARISLSGSTL